MKITVIKTFLATLFIYVFAIANLQALSIDCPDDQWVSCTDEIWDLSSYPNATYTDYGGTHDAGDPVVEYFLNMCDVGTITRTWTVYAYGHSATCTQTFYVEAGIFGYSDITWPLSGLELEGCNADTDPEDLPDGYGAPTYGNTECTLIAVNYSDEIFTISNTCKKMLRTWKVLNWCTYDEYTGAGLWTFTQVIKLIDGGLPVIEDYEPVVSYSSNCLNDSVSVPAISLAPSVCGNEYTVNNNSPYAEFNENDASGVYPIGTTTVKYTVHYACGKRLYFNIDIVVVDNKKPRPYCYAALNVVLMGMDEDGDGINDAGMVEVWASDLDYGSFHTCQSHYPLTLSFSSDPNDNVRTFTCDEVGYNTVEMWVTDRLGNQDFCFVELDVQNNGANITDCEPEPELLVIHTSGYALTAVGEPLEEVKVSIDMMAIEELDDEGNPIEEDASSYSANMMSNRYGFYMFEELEMHVDYHLNFEKEIELSDYVTKEDVRALYQHIVGAEIIDDPYLLIAADINDDQIIDREDLYTLYYYAHGVNPDLGIDKTHVIISSDTELLEVDSYYNGEYVSDINIQNVSNHVNEAGFKMIIKGDLFSTRIKSSLRLTASDEDVEEYLFSNLATVSVSPNPFDELIHFEIDQIPTTNVSIEIFNTQGVKVYNTVQSPKRVYNVELGKHFNGGIYYYNIICGEELHTGKIIKL